MNRSKLFIGGVCAFIGGVILFKHFTSVDDTKSSKQARFTIGILQTASHPALDAVREGFMEELTKSTHSDVAFIVRNGEGSTANIHTIAQQFHNDQKIDAVLAIATPAAQALATVEKNKPIFIAAVTDPDSLGLMHATTNVTGTKDSIDVARVIDMLIALVPTATKVGLLYNNGEINSVFLVKQLRSELEKHTLSVIDFGISSESDLPTAVQIACMKSDVLLTPTDGMVALTISLIASLADKNKKPLIVSDNTLVSYGALASRGVDYKDSGKQTAQMAYQVLIGAKNPYEMPVEQAHSQAIYINKKRLHALGLVVPEALQNNSVMVE